MQGVLVAFFMLFVFWQLDIYDAPNADEIITNLTSIVGAIYFTSVVQMITNFQPTIITFQGEKPIFMRERASDMYDVWLYTMTKFMAELPVLVFTPLVQNLMTYWAIGYQNTFGHFMMFYLVVALTVQSA